MSVTPTKTELNLLRIVSESVGGMSHEDKHLAQYCDDDSTLTNPDVFNRCHDMGWLATTHDNRSDNSTVRITDKGRELVDHAFGPTKL